VGKSEDAIKEYLLSEGSGEPRTSNDVHPEPGRLTDQWQTGVDWLPLSRLLRTLSFIPRIPFQGFPEKQGSYPGDAK
jgi:hypothetical protein